MNIKPILNYKDYFISDCGRIFSDKRSQRKELMTWNQKGYMRVGIRKKPNGKKTQFRVHQLVALHFIKNPKGFKTVNHIDGIRNNNHVSNLEWATMAKQNEHKIKLYLVKEQIKELQYYNNIDEITDDEYSEAVNKLLNK